MGERTRPTPLALMSQRCNSLQKRVSPITISGRPQLTRLSQDVPRNHRPRLSYLDQRDPFFEHLHRLPFSLHSYSLHSYLSCLLPVTGTGNYVSAVNCSVSFIADIDLV